MFILILMALKFKHSLKIMQLIILSIKLVQKT